MFKILKDAKRRTIEQVMYTVGANEKTTDPDYDDHVAQYEMCMGDLNECGAGLSSVLGLQKQYFSEIAELSDSISKIFVKTDSNNSPAFISNLKHSDAALMYHDAMHELNVVTRTSAAAVVSEQSIHPLHAAVTRFGPDIEESCRQRNTSVLDFDSHRRRLKANEQKRDELEAKGKQSTPAHADVLNEIARFQAKTSASEESYLELNAKAKKDILGVKLAHDTMLDEILITTVATQAVLFAQAAKRLEEILLKLPPQKVYNAKAKVFDNIKQGGVLPMKEDKSSFVKGVALFTGKTTLSELKMEEERAQKEDFQNSLSRERAALNLENDTKAKPVNAQPIHTSLSSTSGVGSGGRENAMGRKTEVSSLPSMSPPPLPQSAAPTSPVTANPFGEPLDSNPFGDSRPSSPAPPLSPAMAQPIPVAQPVGNSFVSSARNNFNKSSSPPRGNVATATTQSKAPSSSVLSMRPPPPMNPPQPPSVPAPSIRGLGRVIALFDHVVDADDELEFKAGDIIEVLDKSEEGWWTGRCKGREGLFPINYVKPV